jgi:hypothetical protein
MKGEAETGGDSVPYLNERGVRHGPRRGRDVGGDDAEAEPLERAAQLGDGVPPVAARDAHHQHLIPGARHPHLSNQERKPGRGRGIHRSGQYIQCMQYSPSRPSPSGRAPAWRRGAKALKASKGDRPASASGPRPAGRLSPLKLLIP